MNIKGKNQRQLRKQVLRHVESTFDLARLEYKTRVTPQKHRAKLTGVMVARGAPRGRRAGRAGGGGAGGAGGRGGGRAGGAGGAGAAGGGAGGKGAGGV